MIKLNSKKPMNENIKSSNINNNNNNLSVNDNLNSTLSINNLGLKRYNLNFFEESLGEKLKTFFTRVNKMHNEIKLTKKLRYENEQKIYHYSEKNLYNNVNVNNPNLNPNMSINMGMNKQLKAHVYDSNGIIMNDNGLQYSHNFPNIYQGNYFNYSNNSNYHNYLNEDKAFEFNERNNINCAKFIKLFKKYKDKNKEEGKIY